MKRDMELMRKILFTIEEQYKPGEGTISGLEIDGYDMQIIAEHCDLLYQQGLIKRYESSYIMSKEDIDEFSVGNLTTQGYDYLELIRNNDVWEKTIAEIEEKKRPNTIEEIIRLAGIFTGNVIKEMNG